MHHGSGSRQRTFVEPVGQYVPMVSAHHIHEHGSASSVGSVASSTKLSAAGNAVSRSSRCESSCSDVAGSLAAAQHEVVSDFSFL